MYTHKQRNRPRHIQSRDACRDTCTPGRKQPQKDGVRGASEKESSRDTQRCAGEERERHSKTETETWGETEKKMHTYAYAEGGSNQAQKLALKDRLRDGLKKRGREKEIRRPPLSVYRAK